MTLRQWLNRVGDELSPGHSKIWMMDVGWENRLPGLTPIPRVHDVNEDLLVMQLEQHLFLTAEEGDQVIFRTQPDQDFMQNLSYFLKRALPVPKQLNQWREKSKTPMLVIPYAHDVETEKVATQCLQGPFSIFGAGWETVSYIGNKVNTRYLAEEAGLNVPIGKVCISPEDFRHAYAEILSKGFSSVVIRTSYGSSGKGLMKLYEPSDVEKVYQRLKNMERRTQMARNPFLVEAWHEHHCSLSAIVGISMSGEVELLGITQQLINQSGVYQGNHFHLSLSPVLLEQYRSQVLAFSRTLYDKGYWGIVGIDSVLDRSGQLFPVIEVNTRFTLATYLLDLVKELMGEWSYVTSRYVSFVTHYPYTYKEVHEQLLEELSEHATIYCFAKLHDNLGMFRYRVYILLYSSELDEHDQRLKKLDENKKNILQGGDLHEKSYVS